jgi:hypothetical protein
VIHRGDDHRWDTHCEPRPLELDQLQKQPWLEHRHQHELAAFVECPDHPHHAPGRVEERHWQEHAGAVGDFDSVDPQPGIVDDAAVAQHHSLGESGRAARVLDLRRIIGADQRQRDVASASVGDQLPK